MFHGYSPAERWVDFGVHVAGVAFAVVGGAVAVALAVIWHQTPVAAATLVYVLSLVATLLVSAVYNTVPETRPELKQRLRRADHATIFTLIAGSATPFTWGEAPVGLALVWVLALAAAAARIIAPPWPEGVFVAAYVILGWTAGGLVVFSLAVLPTAAVVLIVIGGVLYTLGVAFHMWRSLKFHNAIWHMFVLSAAVCHYAAVLAGVVLVPALS